MKSPNSLSGSFLFGGYSGSGKGKDEKKLREQKEAI
jgi:hypothetical protein